MHISIVCTGRSGRGALTAPMLSYFARNSRDTSTLPITLTIFFFGLCASLLLQGSGSGSGGSDNDDDDDARTGAHIFLLLFLQK